MCDMSVVIPLYPPDLGWSQITWLVLPSHSDSDSDSDIVVKVLDSESGDSKL